MKDIQHMHYLYRLKKCIRTLLIGLLLVLVLASGGVTPAGAGAPRQDIPIVEPELLVQAARSEPLDFMIVFEEQADLSAAYGMDWESRGWFVYETLTEFADQSQARVRQHLDRRGIDYTSFWINNSIHIPNSGVETLNSLLVFSEIEHIHSTQVYSIIEPETLEIGDVISTQSIQPNITQIKADQAWELGYRGSGLVIANIDSGVHYTHEALVNQYRGNNDGSFDHDFNWYDPHRLYPNNFNYFDFPADPNGHGTHVMGISVGFDGSLKNIGVAPESNWIACRGCLNRDCYYFALLECAQFIAAPTMTDGTNPDPSLRPHVVNNSWGGGSVYDPFFQSSVDSWHGFGIYPVFANGNSGPKEGTVMNPARYGNVTGVGATSNNSGEPQDFSSRGPTDNEDEVNPKGYLFLKPQVVAPGVNIYSSLSIGDGIYGLKTGTSMSAPHVAGLVALMWQAAPCLAGNYASTESLMEQTANPIPIATGNGDEGPRNIPNHATGWGEINALAAVKAAKVYCEGPNIEGKVFDAITRLPISGAVVKSIASDSSSNDKSAITFQSGYYIQSVAIGESYTISADAAGYFPSEPITDVFIEDENTVESRTFYLVNENASFYFFPLFLR